MFIKSCLNLTDFLIFRGTGPELVARFFIDMFIINSFIHLIISFPGVAKHLTFIGYKEGKGLVFFFWPFRWQGEWTPPLREGGNLKISNLVGPPKSYD